MLLPQSSEQRGWAASLLSAHAAAAPSAQSAVLPLQLLLRLHPALATGPAALVLLLVVSHPNQPQLLLLQSSEQRGWAAFHLSVRAAAARAVLSAALPLQLLLRLHPALALVLLLPLSQGQHHQHLAHHLAGLPLPARCQCTACAGQVAQLGLLRSAACYPPAQHQPLLPLLLGTWAGSGPLLLKAAEQLTATSCSTQSACLAGQAPHCWLPQLRPLQRALHLAPCQALTHCALAGSRCQMLQLHRRTRRNRLLKPQTVMAAHRWDERCCYCCCF
jgi:hypothetical protein